VKVGRWLPWIYALPMIVFVIEIFAYPIATLFRYSLQNVGTSAFMPSTFAGLNNFR
jgi:ABC-type sugar transport system permease subunit